MIEVLAAAPSYLAPIMSGSVSILVFVLGVLGVWLRQRAVRRREARETSGDIGTSNAATLWTQSQAYTATMTAALTKAEAQRDRLLELQTTQIVPALTAVNTSLKEIRDVMSVMQGALHRLDVRYGYKVSARKEPTDDV